MDTTIRSDKTTKTYYASRRTTLDEITWINKEVTIYRLSESNEGLGTFVTMLFIRGT